MTTAAMIGKSTSVVPAAFAGGVASPSVGLGATTADAVGSADADGGAETGELGAGGADGGADGGGVIGALTVNVNVPVSRWPSSANAFHWTS